LEAGNQEVFLGRDLMTRSDLSDAVAAKIDIAVRQIVFSCYEETKAIVDQHRECMDRLVDLLIEKETLDGDEFRAIVSEFAVIPAKDRFIPILQSSTPVSATNPS
jgi:cell division protease FtsH